MRFITTRRDKEFAAGFAVVNHLSIIGEIGYRILGGGGAVGAGRELPAHP